MGWCVGFGFPIALARIPREVFHLVNGQMTGDGGDSGFLLQSLESASIGWFLEDAVQNGIPIADLTSNHGHFGRVGHFAGAKLSAFLFSSFHALGPQVVYGVCFFGLFWGEGVIWVGKERFLQGKQSSWDAMLKESLLEFSSVASNTFGVVELQSAHGRQVKLRGPVAQCMLIRHIKPDGVMVSQELAQFKIARSDGDEIGCAKDAVDSSLVDSCLVGSGGEVSWVVKAENHVVHVVAGKHCREGS